jgi:hypothetical protein
VFGLGLGVKGWGCVEVGGCGLVGGVCVGAVRVWKGGAIFFQRIGYVIQILFN